ncbi:putative transcriptional regulatory protein [Neolecta irregularis DAH-3]|uniref:Putative transcriptional regulatory protein n=1 Tax=Neolecta irregularis (strain DAH-3) TaxID=1198029 RepID=A0A1U7LK08_NEOID|nr:putative transcriptional regulatory protein [Neolecta irregularis DAH-3]|eukprot:OLL22987.1 putative transcriptional regulatory protein [Neolecta irregularis DAH-3]
MSDNEPATKRRRISQTCKNCRARKLRCDRRRPCKTCKARSDDCIYDNLGVVIIDEVELKERLRKAEAELAQLRTEIPELSEYGQAALEIEKISVHPSIGYLKPADVDYLKHSVPTQTFIQHIPERIQNLLPSRALSDLILARFYQFVPGAPLLLHIPSFNNEYEAFWSQYHAIEAKAVQPSKLDPQPDRPFWITLLFAIYSTAIRTYVHQNDPVLVSILEFYRMPQMEARISLQNGINDVLQRGEYFESYDLDVITAHCINQHNIDLMSTSFIWMQSGMMVQMAHGLKLFLEPEMLGYSVLETEIRRRLGLMVRVWDVAICYYEGLPTRIRDEDCTALPPSFSEYFDDRGEQQSISWMIHLGKIILIYPQMWHWAYSVKEPLENDILRIDNLFKIWEDEQKRHLTLSFNDSDPSMLLRAFISEFISFRLLLFLHIPFMQSQFPYSMKRGIEGAKRGIELIIALFSASSKIDQYQWYGQIWLMTGSIIAVLVYSIYLVKTEEVDQEHWKLVDKGCEALMNLSQVRNLTCARRPMAIIHELRASRMLSEHFIEDIDSFQKVEQHNWPLLQHYLKSFIKLS